MTGKLVVIVKTSFFHFFCIISTHTHQFIRRFQELVLREFGSGPSIPAPVIPNNSDNNRHIDDGDESENESEKTVIINNRNERKGEIVDKTLALHLIIFQPITYILIVNLFIHKDNDDADNRRVIPGNIIISDDEVESEGFDDEDEDIIVVGVLLLFSHIP
jgi:hypothetical protein